MPEEAPKPGTSALHLCMVGLVLLNLVFVYLTEVASTTSILPLFVLTIASPILARFKENLLYRALWNIGVVGFFGLLVSHVLDRQMSSVLEDGLILAVLCQVHLLNNLHERQRPDLLFLNSYLIAIITGYITVDMGFAGAFLIYAPFYVIGLQFLSASRPGQPMAREDSMAVFIDGMKRSSVIVAMAIVAFLFWPRDFEREALLVKYMEFETSSERAEVAFSETLDLKNRSGRSTKREVVMTAELLEGDPQDVPALWRGATLRIAEKGSWGRAGNVAGSGDPAWGLKSRALAMERDLGDASVVAKLRVVRNASGTKRVFLPRETNRVALDSVHRKGRLLMSEDGTASYSNPGVLRYDVSITDREPGAGATPLTDQALEANLSYYESLHTKSCIGLADALLGRMGGRPSPEQVANEFSDFVSKRYAYRLPGEEGAAGTLHEFLTTDAGGHCEFFASALAIMLRVKGVPARVVTGYRANRWNGATLQVTNMDAHAWVEAHLEGKGWVTLDPTPVGDVDLGGPGFLARLGETARGIWGRVTGFDGEARSEALAWLKAAPGRAYRAALARPWTSFGAALLMGAVVFFVEERRRRRTPLSVRRLETAMRRAGVERHTGETPREALDRVKAALPATEDPEAGALHGLEVAIADHERDRYARP